MIENLVPPHGRDKDCIEIEVKPDSLLIAVVNCDVSRSYIFALSAYFVN